MNSIKKLSLLLILFPLPLAAQTQTRISADNFVRANGPLGVNWTSAFSGSANQPQIVSNLVECTATSNVDCAAVWSGYPDLPNDQFASMTITAHTGATDLISAAVRMQNSTEGLGGASAYAGYHCGDLQSTNVYTKWRVGLDSSFTSLAASAVTVTVNDTVLLTAQGSTLTCFRNGTQVATATDTTFAQGITGYQMSADTTSIADSSFNNFSAGAVSTAPTIIGGTT